MKNQQIDRKRITQLVSAVLTAVFFSSMLWAADGPEKPGSQSPDASTEKVDNRQAFYVRYARGQRDVVRQAVENAGGRVTHKLPSVSTDAVLLPEAAAQALSTRAGVELVEPVPEHRLAGQTVPYNIDQYQARDIWDADRDGVVDANAPDGLTVKFCIIDTGLYAAHDDFVGVTMNGVSQITGEAWSEDGNGHGTHVAGTANAVHNDIGVVGTMPGGAEFFIVKVFNNNGEWTAESSLGAAATSCRDAGANVLSMSLGGGSSATEEAIFQDLYDNYGILNIAAAGNDGNEVASYPASYDSVISVAAIDSDEVVASFSQHPPTSYNPDNPPANVEWDVVELSGGGVDVMSTWPGPPHEGVPLYQVTVNGATYQGTHVDGSGLGDVTGPLVDGGLCDSVGAWTDAVVICERGSISFADKINNVRDGGGLGAVIYNNEAGELLATCGGNCTTPLIPAIGLTQANGQDLVATALNDSANLIADDGTSCTDCTGGYNAISGTSMATPGVAAAVALTWDACGGPTGLTNKQIRQLLRDSAKDLSGTHPGTGFVYGAGWDQATGWGLVQLKDAQELGNQLYGSTCPIGLQAVPATLEVCGATDDSAQSTITLDDAFEGIANMTTSGVPTGASGSFSPNPVEHPTKDTVLTLSGLGSVASGTYDFEAVATDDADSANTASAYLTLDLDAAAPGQTTLQSPADASTGVPLQPTLSWDASSDASDYRVEIATDSGFSSIVYSATVTGTTHALATELDSIKTYYWRVTPANLCGDGDASATFSFTTTNVVCELIESTDVPQAIADATGNPNNPTPGVTDSTLTSNLEGSLLEVEIVGLQGTHTWINDLSFDLLSPDSTTVRVMERSCDSENDFHLSLDDDASGSPGGWPCPPTDQGTYQPSNPLAGFEGLAANGQWTLRVTDHAKQDEGTLEGWGLNLCVEGQGISASTTEITQVDPTAEQTVHEPYTVHVTVSGDSPTGTVTVDDGTGGSCAFTLPDTSCAMTSTTVGAKTITAEYAGDDNNGASSDTAGYTILAADPDSLVFDVQPTDTATNEIIDPAIVVHVHDQYGNLVDWDNTTEVDLTLAGGAASAKLSGGGPVPVSGGVATFAGLSVDLAGIDYQLQAADSAVALTGASSTLFDIFEFASTTTITGIDPADSQRVGEAYTVSVDVTGEDPTGIVTVSDGAGSECQIDLDLSETSCALTSNVVGDKVITAQYPGDTNDAPSDDATNYTIGRALSIVEITAVDPVDSQKVDEVYTVHVSVDGHNVTGEVMVTDGAGADCLFKLPDNSSCELISDSSGARTLVASYEGDVNNEPDNHSVGYEIISSGPTQLHFSVHPEYGFPADGIFPDVVVQVRDSENNLVEDDNSTIVVISLETNPTAAALTGTLSRTVSNGEAVFADLEIDQTGTGYRLQASDDVAALNPALSEFFDVVEDLLFQDRFAESP